MFGSAHVTAQLNIPVGFSAPAHRVCAMSRGSLFSGQVANRGLPGQRCFSGARADVTIAKEVQKMTDSMQDKPKRRGRVRVFGARAALTIRIAPEDAAALRAMAAEQGMPITQILAQAVQAVVAQRQ
jgi:predicted DNA binding CopG/RHH family protein